MREPVDYPATLLRELARLCEASPDRERCGFVVRVEGALAAEPVENLAEGRDAFLMDPRAELRLLKALRARGGAVVAIWHAHLDAPAVLSARDRDGAAPDGVEAFPGAEQLVFGLRAGRVVEVRRYRWEGGAFREVSVRYNG